jgi:predicted small lipoprotein YifL
LGKNGWGIAPVAPVDRKIVTRVIVAGMVVAAVGLAGCGRKGALEPPPGATLKAAEAPAPDAPPKPDKPFFMDPPALAERLP